MGAVRHAEIAEQQLLEIISWCAMLVLPTPLSRPQKTSFFMATVATVQYLLLLLLRAAATRQRTKPWVAEQSVTQAVQH